LKASVGEGLRIPVSVAAEGATGQIDRINFLVKELEKRVARVPGMSANTKSKIGIGQKIAQGPGGIAMLASWFALNNPLVDRAMAADKAARDALTAATGAVSNPTNANPRDAEAAGLAAINGKESDLNELLLRRIQIMDMLAAKEGLSSDAAESLGDALRRVNEQITLAGIKSNKIQALFQRNFAQDAVTAAEDRVAKAEAYVTQPGLSAELAEKGKSAITIAKVELQQARQRLRAAQEFFDLTREDNPVTDDGAEKPKATADAKAKKSQGGFGLGNVGQQRAGAYTGPALTMIDLNRQQLRELQAIKNRLPPPGSDTAPEVIF
jgi:hypothetical protein